MGDVLHGRIVDLSVATRSKFKATYGALDLEVVFMAAHGIRLDAIGRHAVLFVVHDENIIATRWPSAARADSASVD